MRSRSHPVLTVILAVCFTAAFGTVLATADTSISRLRLVYLSSDSTPVDFYVDHVKALSGIGYRTITSYMEVSPSAHFYEVRRAGSPPDSTPLTQITANLGAGEYYSMVAAGKIDEMKSAVLDDATPPNPPPDQCVARFLHAALQVQKVDVVVNGTTVRDSGVSFMEASGYQKMPAGTYDIEVRAAGTSQVIYTAKNFEAEGGHFYTLAAAGGVGRPVELVEMYDSSSAEVTPAAGVQTGEGGMAFRRLAPVAAAALGILGLLGFALLRSAVLLVRRRKLAIP